MKTAKLIKAAPRSTSEKRTVTAASPETVRNWMREYQRQKPSNPREQFARLFKLAA